MGLKIPDISAKKRLIKKTNEITAIPVVLEMLDIKNAVISIDAMGAQREICAMIIAKEGGYVIGLKENQPSLHEDVQDHFRMLPDISYVSFSHCDKGKKTEYVRYYISSLPADAERLLRIIRAHWGIENQLHWVLDCSWNEDNACIRLENSALNMSTGRKIALNILHAAQDPKKSLKSSSVSVEILTMYFKC